jgi:hypothetical protein
MERLAGVEAVKRSEIGDSIAWYISCLRSVCRREIVASAAGRYEVIGWEIYKWDRVRARLE